MREVLEDPLVTAELDRLWQSGRDSLVSKVDEVVDWITSGDPRAKRHRIDAPPLEQGFAWAVSLSDQGETWLVVWSPTADDQAKLHAVTATDLL